MATVTHTELATKGVFSPLTGLFQSVEEYLRKRREYRKTLVELESLTDAHLADLGLSRSSIRSVAYEASYGA